MRHSWNNVVAQTYGRTIQKLVGTYSMRQWLGVPLISESLEKAARGGKPIVSEDTPDSIAGQFYVFMPPHTFKVERVLDLLREKDESYIRPLLTARSSVAIVDIGCGGGAASTAVIDTILRYQTTGLRTLFVGVEVNKHALNLYDCVMKEHESQPNLTIEINSHAILKGIPGAFTYIAEGIERARQRWNLPSLNDIWIIQSNVVRPLQEQHTIDVEDRVSLGLTEDRGLISDDFGIVEARGYEQLLRLTRADRMLVITIATVDQNNWHDTAHQLGNSIVEVFNARSHEAERVHNAHSSAQPLSVEYENPHKSYWRDQGTLNWSTTFYTDVVHIENHAFRSDVDWQQIISPENLRLAWYRVRAAMMREALTDEIELLLFDLDAETRLEELRTQLLTYTTNVIDFPRFFYLLPKKPGEARQKGLQTVEEELLAIAIIQVLGIKTQGLIARSYAYRLDLTNKSEFLYHPWFHFYRHFRKMIRISIKGQDENAGILRTDITRFFNNIPQEDLLRVVVNYFQAKDNPRIQWLLRQLIVRQIDEHGPGLGVMQGPSTSGFLANLYLLSLDQKYSDERSDGVLFFRYVDDIVGVAAESNRIDQLETDLQADLEKLGLILSNEKTSKPSRETALDEFARWWDIEELDKAFRRLTVGLYFANRAYQTKMIEMDNREWWKWVRQYQRCLSTLGIFIEETRLSRKVWQYANGAVLYGPRRSLPRFQDTNTPSSWAEQYGTLNSDWLTDYASIKIRLSTLLRDFWNSWRSTEEDGAKKELQTRLTFALNRLAILGYEDVLAEVVQIFCDAPFLIKGHRFTLEHLALQQHANALWEIWGCIRAAVFPGSGYIRAMLMRSFRYLEPIQSRETEVLLHYSLRMPEIEPVELLIVTETLINIGYTASERESKEFLQRGKDFAETEPRIARNFVMLAGQSPQNPDYSALNEYLADIYSMAQSDDWRRHYSEPEREEIRKDFYHPYYSDGPDEFAGDYF